MIDCTTRQPLRRSRFVPSLCASLTLLPALVACGSDPAESAPEAKVDLEQMWRVASDDEASLDEIVEAGRAVDADFAADGSAMVIYEVVSENGKAKQSAWRLYDTDGTQVAVGRGGRAAENSTEGGVLGLADTFLLAAGRRNLLVGADGSAEDVPRAPRRLPVKEGDLRYQGLGGSMFRPDPPTTYIPAPRNPEGERNGWTVDPAGVRWLQTTGPEALHRTTEAGKWEQVRAVDLEEGEYLLGDGVTAVGDRLALPIATDGPGRGDVLVTAIAQRRTDGLRMAPWRYLAATPFQEGQWTGAPVVFAADEDNLVISYREHGAHRLDVSTGEWFEIGRSTEEEGWELEPGRGGLFGFHEEHAEARFTDDWGETWETLPR